MASLKTGLRNIAMRSNLEPLGSICTWPRTRTRFEKLAAENGNTVADLSIRGAKRLLAPQPTEEQKGAAEVDRDAKKAEREANKKAKAEAAKAATKAIVRPCHYP